MKNEYHKNLLSSLSNLMSQHQEGTVYVTEKLRWEMRNVTKRARKNYMGVYDEPYDPVTGEEKYFPPLTESFTDSLIKSVDVDLKDIQLYSTNGAKVGATKILEQVLRQKLKDAGFAETLNTMTKYLCTDGEAILKFMEGSHDGKPCMYIKAVDQLNFICDQSADDVNSSFGSIERALMTQEELRKKDKVWYNIEEVIKNTNTGSFQRSAFFDGSTVQSPAPYYPIYDYWGQMELCAITGKEKDKGHWVEGHAVVANLHDSGKAIVLLVEENKKCLRPYDSASLKKVIGRRQGRGVPEMLFGTQKYMNMLVEIRKKNAQILQNGLFKAKKNMGMTADSILSKIGVGGIIQVQEMEDFQQMPIQDSRAASYGDEDRLLAWGERNTGMYDVRRGEATAASAPATASLIQDRNSRDLIQLAQENLGLMLERFIQNHVLPWVLENTKRGEIVAITGSLKDLEDIDNAIAEHLVGQEIANHIEKHKSYPDPQQVVDAKERQKNTLKKMGSRRYLELKKLALKSSDVGINVVITNEYVDRPTILGKLQEILSLSVAAPGAMNIDPSGVIDTIFGIMGIPTDRIYSQQTTYRTPIDKMAEGLAKEKAAMAQQPKAAIQGAMAPQMKSGAETKALPGPAMNNLNAANQQSY